MRVTAQAKEQTRQRILASSRKLFSQKGLERTTTRDIAGEAGIASGTLFNYFPSKEVLAMTIVAEALDEGRADYAAKATGQESVEEALFLHIVTGLRRLAPYRTSMNAILERAMSPFSPSPDSADADRVRRDHLEAVAEILANHARRNDQTRNQAAGEPEPDVATADLNFVAMHLYWSLYLGVLAFWSRDQSDKQEHTLAMLDQAMQLFVDALNSGDTEENTDGATSH
ncbi:MAG: TetR/AcrR family transcriptional regulator [Phycisphaerales bacterium]|nr:MAG: TetR/AcrR family transcriptional regulator [Phycisphaerales bacterium]